MKKIALLSVMIPTLLFLAACETSAAPAQPVAATQSGAGASSGTEAAAAGTGTEVDVTLQDNTITSSLTTFKAGVPYRFVVINNGNHLHNFNISTPVSVAGSLDAALSNALLTVTQDKLPIGGGTTMEYTFPASAVGKPLEFSCLIRRHYEDGMKLGITVTN
jgi:uncharacterized cupredoxin-like copper-binding protein